MQVMADLQTMLTSLEETKIQEVQLQELKVGQAACHGRIPKLTIRPKITVLHLNTGFMSPS